MAAGKSLTEPPKNLKEAIDWVLRVSGGDQGSVPYPMNFVKTLHLILNTIPHTEDDFRSKALKEIKIDENAFQKGFIYRLAEGLQKFIGYGSDVSDSHKWKIMGSGIVQKGVLSSAYTTAYRGSWSTEVYSYDFNNSKRKRAVQCFFAAIQLIYEGLTELFFNCKTEWASQSLNNNGNALHKFMTTNGFSGTQLNTNMDGNKITSQALHGLSEFSTAYDAAGENASLDAFRSQLEQNAWSNPSTSSLSALYIIATYVYVQSASPASPSFLGYSGLGALAGGAYGLNLGGLGTLMSGLLA
ncbi:variant erythrocyte surface antigen-1 family protein [Babesia caballi]|uniref:Variant erythrocyte surface antigen-1 family protein n=1 Tax=Babesia caballi TaxID=5871 RepID=A0AAV4LMM9_BABCB|nr:variant erythrocyte surface antigen-1 family protein [Babesia caballi]